MEDVTVHKTEQIVAHIRFKGGATQTIMVALPLPFALTAEELAQRHGSNNLAMVSAGTHCGNMLQ
jgi:uncharacterized protein YybS (DUF2232 family)